MPQGVPSLSLPSDDKQDINQLQSDVPKWKPWLSDHSWEEWSDFLKSGIRKLSQLPSISPEWPLETLKDSCDYSQKRDRSAL